MKFLRTISTRRLLASIVGLVVAVGGGTAIAVAASGPGPVPKSESLAKAVHGALAAPKVAGITADITFTNNLIGSTAFAGGSRDPILQGATGRLWLSNDHQLRVELQSSNGDAQVLVNQHSFWVSDPSSHTVYEGTIGAGKTAADHGAPDKPGIPSIAKIQSELNKLMSHVDVSGAIPSDVAGHGAYTVRVSPKHDGGLLGSAELAWDAARGVPLRFAIYARGNPAPVLELKATNISYGAVPASDFAVTPPAGDKVVKISSASAHGAGSSTRSHSGRDGQRELTGASAVAASLPFKLVAPAELVGLPRHTVKGLDWGGHPAALVTYGQNLGGIVVIEQTASTATSRGNSASHGNGSSQDSGSGGLNLPTVSINGATGHELDTALGTVVRFTRGGVAYTVLGSVPPAAADAAARAL